MLCLLVNSKIFVNANGTAQKLWLVCYYYWQDEIYRTAVGTDHNIAFSGGADNVVYRASVGYANLNGILKRDNMQERLWSWCRKYS
jgi:iron complex outermembrane receptor protein